MKPKNTNKGKYKHFTTKKKFKIFLHYKKFDNTNFLSLIIENVTHAKNLHFHPFNHCIYHGLSYGLSAYPDSLNYIRDNDHAFDFGTSNAQVHTQRT